MPLSQKQLYFGLPPWKLLDLDYCQEKYLVWKPQGRWSRNSHITSFFLFGKFGSVTHFWISTFINDPRDTLSLIRHLHLCSNNHAMHKSMNNLILQQVMSPVSAVLYENSWKGCIRMTMQSAQQCNPHHDAILQWNSHNKLGWNAYNKTRIRQCATHDSMRTMEFGRWSPHTGQHDAILQNLQCNPQRHRPKAPARGTGQRHRPKAPAKGTCQRHRPKTPSRPA